MKTKLAQKPSLFSLPLLLLVTLMFVGCGKENARNPIAPKQGATDASGAEGPSLQGTPGAPGTLGDKKTKAGCDKPVPTPPKQIAECRFVREKPMKKGNFRESCIVSALISPRADYQESNDQREAHKNRLVVACNGRTLYSDGASHSHVNGFDALIANGDQDQAIILMYLSRHLHDDSKRPGQGDHDLDHHDDSNTESWLTIGRHQLKGTCEFSETNDEEHHLKK